jgi:hypothetical protein
MLKKQKWLNKKEAIELGLTPKENEKNRNQARYKITPEEWESVVIKRQTPNKREFVEIQKKYDKNGEISSTLEKLQSKPIEIPENFEVIKVSTSKTTGQQWVQYAAKKQDVEVKDIDFDNIIQKHIKPVKVQELNRLTDFSSDFDSLTYTDVHVAMETDADNNSMYSVKWDKDEIIKTANLIAQKTIKEQTASTLYIDELGDFLDGFNSQTTRGGHHLPQNMTNEEAFDCALLFKMIVIDILVNYYDKIVCNNICNDNHAGSFGYFVNSAFEKIVKQKYSNVKVNNHRKFINHYFVNDICFLISHGKDDKTLKFGFKPFLDSKGLEKIDQYCKQNKIYKTAELIIFKKGDSHQCLFDMCTSDDFYYYNYPALSPSSQWVQNNFKKGRRGFVNESFKGLENNIKVNFIK